jgi:hypothetical protein
MRLNFFRSRPIVSRTQHPAGVRFPKWQVTANGGLLPELPRLFDLLGGDSWTVYRLLTQRHPELEGVEHAPQLDPIASIQREREKGSLRASNKTLQWNYLIQKGRYQTSTDHTWTPALSSSVQRFGPGYFGDMKKT